jgi:hypothetical protein
MQCLHLTLIFSHKIFMRPLFRLGVNLNWVSLFLFIFNLTSYHHSKNWWSNFQERYHLVWYPKGFKLWCPTNAWWDLWYPPNTDLHLILNYQKIIFIKQYHGHPRRLQLHSLAHISGCIYGRISCNIVKVKRSNNYTIFFPSINLSSVLLHITCDNQLFYFILMFLYGFQ